MGKGNAAVVAEDFDRAFVDEDAEVKFAFHGVEVGFGIAAGECFGFDVIGNVGVSDFEFEVFG